MTHDAYAEDLEAARTACKSALTRVKRILYGNPELTSDDIRDLNQVIVKTEDALLRLKHFGYAGRHRE